MLDSENASINLSKLELSFIAYTHLEFLLSYPPNFRNFANEYYRNWRQAVVGSIDELIECPQFYTSFHKWTCLQH